MIKTKRWSKPWGDSQRVCTTSITRGNQAALDPGLKELACSLILWCLHLSRCATVQRRWVINPNLSVWTCFLKFNDHISQKLYGADIQRTSWLQTGQFWCLIWHQSPNHDPLVMSFHPHLWDLAFRFSSYFMTLYVFCRADLWSRIARTSFVFSINASSSMQIFQHLSTWVADLDTSDTSRVSWTQEVSWLVARYGTLSSGLMMLICANLIT